MKTGKKKLHLAKATILKLENTRHVQFQGGKYTDLCPTRISLAPTCNKSQRELCCG